MDETFTNFVKLVGTDKAREFIQRKWSVSADALRC